jgi:hypothetical protein
MSSVIAKRPKEWVRYPDREFAMTDSKRYGSSPTGPWLRPYLGLLYIQMYFFTVKRFDVSCPVNN